MRILTRCTNPDCHAAFKVDVAHVGRTTPCPKCKTPFIISRVGSIREEVQASVTPRAPGAAQPRRSEAPTDPDAFINVTKKSKTSRTADNSISDVASLPDELGFVTACGNSLAWWRFDGTPEQTWDDENPFFQVACSNDGELIGTASLGVRVWELPGGQMYNPCFRWPLIFSARFSPNGLWYAIGKEGGENQVGEGNVNLLRASRLREEGYFSLSATDDCLPISDRGLHDVWSLAFSPDSRLLAIQSYDADADVGHVSVWDFLKRSCLYGGDPGGFATLELTRDSLILGYRWLGPEKERTYPDAVKVLDLKSGKQRVELHRACGNIAASRDGKLLATCSTTGGVRLWNAQSWELLREIELPRGAVASRVALSPEKDRIVCGTTDGSAVVYSIGGARRVEDEQMPQGSYYELREEPSSAIPSSSLVENTCPACLLTHDFPPDQIGTRAACPNCGHVCLLVDKRTSFDAVMPLIADGNRARVRRLFGND